jgi:hypothetical protein
LSGVRNRCLFCGKRKINTGSLTLSGGYIRNNEAVNGGVFNGGEGELTLEQNVVVKKVGITIGAIFGSGKRKKTTA